MDLPARNTISVDDLRGTFGLGVAGNFAGHLEQAGEAADFARVAAPQHTPKGIFPWYVPGATSFLGDFPLSSDTLVLPAAGSNGALRVQVEPEVAVMCCVRRDGAGRLVGLDPQWVAAFDDCSLRRPDADKISEKKNWGAGSTGLATTVFEVHELAADGPLSSMRLACFLRRGDETHAYGTDSALPGYTLFGDALLDWLVDRLRSQAGGDGTPLEDVGALLDASEATSVLVGIGASRYEPYGESTFVEPGDEAIVVVYDADSHPPEQVADLVGQRRDDELEAASVLRRVARRGT